MKRLYDRKRTRRGQTLTEMVLALSLTAVVCLVGLSTFLTGVGAWYRGQARISSEAPAQMAVRRISTQLREAMSVTVSADGKSLTYKLPILDGTGTFVQPATWDGITRTISLNGTTLQLQNGTAPAIPLCTNVITTDPLSAGGTAAYQIFTPGQGTITRSLTVMVVSQQSAYNSKVPVYGRHRETIYFRNVPVLSQ